MKIEILGMGCGRCQALYNNAKKAVAEMNIEVEILKVEDVAKITEYGVLVTPALAIDGKLVLSGKVPTPEEIKNIITNK